MSNYILGIYDDSSDSTDHESTLVQDYRLELQASQSDIPISSTVNSSEPIDQPIKNETRKSERVNIGVPPDRYTCKTE